MCGGFGGFFTIIIILILVYYLSKMMNFNDIKNLFKSRTRPITERDKDFDYNRSRNKERLEVDKILDKINKYGYNNLTKKEKDFLKSKGR